jgi:hypothetical protein
MREEQREPEARGRSEDGGGGGRMLVPAVSCPRCGSRPALRVSEPLARRVEDLPPGQRVGSYKCQRRACGEIYEIPASAYQNAR